MIKQMDQWISSIREASLLPLTPVRQKDGRWKVVERLQVWKEVGPRIFDEHLERFQKIAIDVLSERDPQFDLPRERRYAANILGKVMKHSYDLRNGLAETLALLGNYGERLTSCTLGKPQGTARIVVRRVLENGNWEIWASLNYLLPLLAEAAPKEFLSAVEKSLEHAPSQFDDLFAQEAPAFYGNNYMTGLLWALEGLAWDPDHLAQVITILGDLAARDPGGNWANRPANSLRNILLPWFPQTLAPISRRVAAVRNLQREQPNVAWKLIVSLLPLNHRSTSGTHKPTWRKTIPANWKEGATQKEYLDQVSAYAEMAANQSMGDHNKLVTLIDHLHQLPPATRQRIVSHLRSEQVLSLPEEARLTLWNELIGFVARHRKFSKADWALGSIELNEIAEATNHLEPQQAFYKYVRLFTARNFDLYEEAGNYARQTEKLYERRKAAVQEVYSEGGLQAVISFAESVTSPDQVGFVFGVIASPSDEQDIVPELFKSESTSIIQFRAGFVTGRFRTESWEWVDSIDMTAWSSEDKATLLSYLPFSSDTWSRATGLLQNEESMYWQRTHASPYDATNEELPYAIDRLIDHGRPNAAIFALERLIYSEGEIQPHQVVKALYALLQSSEALATMDAHAVVELIQRLQKDPNTNRDDLITLEWRFLELLDGHFGGFPVLLNKTLAQDPKFFCEIIQAVFRSDKEEKQRPVTEQQQAIADNAYNLLRAWKTPPGKRSDGTLDGEELRIWLDSVKEICIGSGHLKIAMQQVGKALFYAPPDPSGLWIHEEVAEVLNAKTAVDLRLGYETETINSRGLHAVDPEGKGERELARHYRQRAEEVELKGFQRLAVTLRDVAETYDREAEQIARRFDSN